MNGEARYESFLAGDRPDDVLVYLHEDGVGSVEDLLEIGTRVDDGVVLVLPGDDGRAAFESATGLDPMAFAGAAMDTDGDVGDEEQNEAVGDLYAEGDVMHAYAACDCGTTYSEKWVVDG
ncbi:hypothetical protein BRD05_08325 [Halobacteriales archaeon QS_9_70_65]|nr:MAG: hypothetical protein BRD05_08325 [Halobacteriales archaeon QS_9_70_65]